MGCGENHISCLEFHHLDPTVKEGAVSNLIRVSFERALKEIEKCIVLCSNCHKKEHWDENKIEKLKCDIIELKKQKEKRKGKKEKNLCRGCGTHKDDIKFIKGRCFCEKCFREHQKNKMRKRRKNQ